MTKKVYIASDSSHWCIMPSQKKLEPCVEVVVNHMGGMGGGRETLYCQGSVCDIVNNCGLIKLTTMLGHSVAVSVNQISTIKDKCFVSVVANMLKWNGKFLAEAEWSDVGARVKQYYVTDRDNEVFVVPKANGAKGLSNVLEEVKISF